MPYYNYSTIWPDDWWGRRSFLRAWWSLYATDHRWVPPDYNTLARLLQRGSPFLARLSTQPVYMEALPRRAPTTGQGTPALAGALFEEPVAAALVQFDGRRRDSAAYLSLLRCGNDEETLERFLYKVFETLAEAGCARLIGPTGLTPLWQSGALLTHFDRLPPLHTPYNPPYLADVMAAVMRPVQESSLFCLEVGNAVKPALPNIAGFEVHPFDPARLATDLLPLLVEAFEPQTEFPAPDAGEAALLLKWLQAYPLAGWLAQVDGAPVGFVLVQNDLAGVMRQSRGGRLLPWRWYAAWRKRHPTSSGRLLLGAVTADWRGRGIGRSLLQKVLEHARAAAWRSVTCGPLLPGSPAAAFWTAHGAHAEQRYQIFEWSPW